MKTVQQISQQLTKQWQNPKYRIQRLLGNDLPFVLNIGKPRSKDIKDNTHSVRQHLQQWQDFDKKHIGSIDWQSHHYRALGSSLNYPASLTLHTASDWQVMLTDPVCQQQLDVIIELWQQAFVQAFRQNFPELSLAQLSVFVRQIQHIHEYPIATLIQLLLLANILSPNCAQGLPLRALTLEQIIDSMFSSSTPAIDLVQDNLAVEQKSNATAKLAKWMATWTDKLDIHLALDSKFMERHRHLLTLLLDTRFLGQVNRLGLDKFLGADKYHTHWLLLLDGNQLSLDHPSPHPQWMPFAHMRVRDTDLATMTAQALPHQWVLIVENEQCLHLLVRLQQYLADTLVILGAGRNLAWLAGKCWQHKQLGYWGDIDSWGLAMLSQARSQQPHLTALMMDDATWQQHQSSSVSEGTAYPSLPSNLQTQEQELFLRLVNTPDGNTNRLEQEYLHPQWVEHHIRQWKNSATAPLTYL